MSMTRAGRVTADAASFGQVIRRLRLSQGWTMTELARRSGLNKNHLGLLELGKNTPSLNMLFALSDLFRVDACDIVREVEQSRRERRAHRAAAMLAAAGLALPEGNKPSD
jgi:transcriptional regulator with XRE-family HTH domain